MRSWKRNTNPKTNPKTVKAVGWWRWLERVDFDTEKIMVCYLSAYQILIGSCHNLVIRIAFEKVTLFMVMHYKPRRYFTLDSKVP